MSKLYVLFAALILVAGSLIVNAVTPDDQANQFSIGSAALGVTLTTDGDLVPNVTGAVDLGTTTYKFGALNMSGNALIGGTLGVTGISSLAAVTATTLSTSGVVTVESIVRSSSTVISKIYSVTASTPAYKGQLVIDSSYVLYIGTGTTNDGQWVKIGGQ